MLDKQVHLYSLDTSCFYTPDEMEIHKKLVRLYSFRAKVQNLHLKKKLRQSLHDKYLTKVNHWINSNKELMYEALQKHSEEKIVRNLRPDTLIPKNVVSIFESQLTRTMGLQTNVLTTDLMIISVFFFEVAQDLIKRGFDFNGEHYVLYTASAGQIRTKKFVMIKESVFEKHKNTLMCGLTVDKINERGGVNVNKYLAYFALTNSATDVWEGFDITKSIVVDDFETNVEGTVDFINDVDYSIERKTMPVPIPHMDGCGIMLDDLTTMVRLPWIKGLMVRFDFVKFIEQTGASSVVTDIYGREVDIVAEGVRYIFTKSQFKMWKYYDSWQEYVDNFQKYGCVAGVCNTEEDKIPDATINYQMLQTLSDMTEDEMRLLAKQSVRDIEQIGADYQTTIRLLGVTPTNTNKNYMQQALEIYPELLRDTYSKNILKDVKKSLIKEAKAGKLLIRGKYTFLSPDLYAFCEWLFLHEKVPQGLLKNGEVSCNLYRDGRDLDCLRSPHLYREHAVRTNVVNDDTKQWFDTKCIYTSSFDTISKILQFDK